MFTLFPITSTLQKFLLLPWRKNKIVLANRPVFTFDKCPTTTSHFPTETANLSNSFAGCNRAFHHVSMITFCTLWVILWAILLLMRFSCLTCLFVSLLAEFEVHYICICFWMFQNVWKFNFVNVTNSYIVMHNQLLAFHLLFTFKHVRCWKT